MILKARKESDYLLAFRFLNKRIELTEKDKSYYLHLEKGYEGEVKFDQLVENLKEQRYIINDLLLEINNSYFQIDSLIISQGGIYLLDIKNFTGDCYYESDKFYSMKTGREYKNPIDQLKRSVTLFRQFLQLCKQYYIIEPSVIFINNEFTLYQAPKDKPIIFPTQLNRFITNLNKTPSTLDNGHKKLAQTLLSLHQTKNPFEILPPYNFNQLRKGITCLKCSSFSISINRKKCICRDCSYQEAVPTAVIRTVNEFQVLFPSEKITTNVIHEWCKVIDSKKRIGEILRKHYTVIGVHQWTYYE
ncbi:nuclease-related domain-containing protein [Mesobacillus maritimus]|uniref:NERD domain-containing protein n=1 Tax=Mesobacillus maritimus TaxID=1643336 RepID=A0ABS7KBM1_9BACI|nr:nuclease-related domain-containing protein [Mesobacillus maritimus]MBY0099654.1 NERD domain-containing protein [Mesobacillus maritimus]